MESDAHIADNKYGDGTTTMPNDDIDGGGDADGEKHIGKRDRQEHGNSRGTEAVSESGSKTCCC